jgi:hypothetical protein
MGGIMLKEQKSTNGFVHQYIKGNFAAGVIFSIVAFFVGVILLLLTIKYIYLGSAIISGFGIIAMVLLCYIWFYTMRWITDTDVHGFSFKI